MTAPSAYRIAQAVSIAQATLARLHGDSTLDAETDEAALLAALEAEGADVETILRRVIQAALEARSNAAAADKRAKAIAARVARYERQENAWRGAAFAVMDALGITSLRDPEFTATISKPKSGVVITDEALIPDEFWITPPRRLKKAEINDAVLKNGEIVPGTELANGLPTLTIRTS